MLSFYKLIDLDNRMVVTREKGVKGDEVGKEVKYMVTEKR